MSSETLMSVAEAGVVLGVLLEGTEYIKFIHQRWPALERIGFAILILSLVADWRFQSQINEQHTQALLAADNRIASLTKVRNAFEEYLSPRSFIRQQQTDAIVAKLKPFAPQEIDLYWYPADLEANSFEGTMNDLLKFWCGWKVKDVPLDHGEYGSAVWDDSQDSRTSKAAHALTDALRDDLHLAIGGPAGSLMETVGEEHGLLIQRPIHDRKIVFVIGSLATAKELPQIEKFEGISK
jgi:hypothetical protein